MKKNILVLFLLICTVIFAQDKKDKQKVHKPIQFSIGFDTEFFYQGTARITTTNSTLIKYFVKSEGYAAPMFGLHVQANKPLNKHILLGLELGLTAVKEERNRFEPITFYMVPISLNLTCNFWKDKKTILRPSLTVQGGYTYMKDVWYPFDDIYEIKGGLSYGFKFGIGIKNKNSKLLDNMRITFGYHNFFTNHHEEYNTPPITNAYADYKVRREGFVMGIQYQIPHKKKRKRRKRH